MHKYKNQLWDEGMDGNDKMYSNKNSKYGKNYISSTSHGLHGKMRRDVWLLVGLLVVVLGV